MSDTDGALTGGCLCGAVTYEILPPFRGVVACHCHQCRKTSGHFVAATAAGTESFRLTRDRGLKWYSSSAEAERGFCGECGSSLFYRRRDADRISIMAGTLNGSTGLRLVSQIYTESAGDYYTIDPTIPVISLEQLQADSALRD